MKIDELIKEKMYALIAPDGSIQIATLSPDFETCLGFIEIMNDSGVGLPYNQMIAKGFDVKMVTVTITAE